MQDYLLINKIITGGKVTLLIGRNSLLVKWTWKLRIIRWKIKSGKFSFFTFAYSDQRERPTTWW